MSAIASLWSCECRAALAAGCQTALAACVVVLLTGAACGQVIITEIMFNPLNPGDRPWEWVEIKNVGGAAVNLDGWVFADRSSRYSVANLEGGAANLTVPAGGVAVIYDAPQLGHDPQRFYDAWGAGIQLIPVNTWRALANSGDRIGLWDSYAAYNPAGGAPTAEPAWENAVFEVDYGTGDFPPLGQGNGRSFAWSGVGDPRDGANWVASVAGELGAYTSVQTVAPGVQINNPNDRGTPGIIFSAGTPPAGKLLITEIMFDPASSVAGSNDERPFEWIEILNNTGSTIDFSATPFVFDDLANPRKADYNVTSGVVPHGGIAVLFGSSASLELTVAQMKDIWEPEIGAPINFIPVSNWPFLNNTGVEAIGLWDDLAAYHEDWGEAGSGPSDPTTWASALAVVTYNGGSSDGWPGRNNSASIYLNNLGGDPMLGSNWTLSGSPDDPHPAANASPLFADAVDHVGGDVGSPGFVPGTSVVLAGDFNGDGRVDAADYTVWRDGGGLPAQYNLWRFNFGATAFGGGRALGSRAAVPEPAVVTMLVIGVALTRFRQRWRPALR